MSIAIQHVVDGKAKRLEYHFEQGWTWNDLYSAKQEADRILEEAEYPMAVLINLLKVEQVPPGILTHCRIMVMERHPNGRPVIVVTGSFFIRSMVDILRTMFPRRLGDIYCVSTLTDACRYLENRDGENRDSSPV